MEQFVKLTQITGRKVENDEKTATGVKPIYVRPWDIESFLQDEDGVTVVKFNNHQCIRVAETPEEIYKMVSEEKNEPTKLNDPYKVIPYPIYYEHTPSPIYYEHTPSWWDAPWWKNPTITCNTATTISEGAVCACNTSDTADLLFRVTPNYTSAIIVGNGEIWE